MFQNEKEIRLLQDDDSIDLVININDFNVKSFVSVDNFEQSNFERDHHALIDKAELPIEDTFNRLIRRNAEIK
jgi:hypothetical protein